MSKIELREVSKRFGLTRALHRVSWSIDRGDLWLLAGANGAGKSTLLRCLAGIERPDSGSISIDGYALSSAREHRELKRSVRLGVLFAQSFLYGDLTVRENLDLYARLDGLPLPEKRAVEVAERFGLDEYLDTAADHCSQGIARRTAIARLLLQRPQLILLDEPSVNLDAAGRAQLVTALRDLRASGATILVATHEPELFGNLGGKVMVLSRGEIQSGQPADAPEVRR